MKKTTSPELHRKPNLDTHMTSRGVPVRVEESARRGIRATEELEVIAHAPFLSRPNYGYGTFDDDDDTVWDDAQYLIEQGYYSTPTDRIDVVNKALRVQEALSLAAHRRQTEIDEALAIYSAQPERGLIGRLLHGPNPSPDPELVKEKGHVDRFVAMLADYDEHKAAAVELRKKYGGVLYDLALRDAESDGVKISRGE